MFFFNHFGISAWPIAVDYTQNNCSQSPCEYKMDITLKEPHTTVERERVFFRGGGGKGERREGRGGKL